VGRPKLRYVAIEERSGELVFNTKDQSPFFTNQRSLNKAIKDSLDEPEGEDLDSGEITTAGDESGAVPEDYIIFLEVSRGKS